MLESVNSFSPIAVLGAGAWGTALALHLARNGQAVKLWAYEKEQVEQINTTRYNTRYLPDEELPSSIVCSHDYETVLADVRDVLIVVPSTAFRATLLAIKPLLKSNQRVLWATKGLDEDKHQLLHEVASEILGDVDMAVLSGPSFAKEVAMGLPTAVTIASNQQAFANDLQQRFRSDKFHVELTKDIIGVELGGAVKNILAIAVGMTEGLGFGANAKAALMTKGLSEMIALGSKLGAEQETFLGLSGLGDLILTCTDNQSRNRRLGLALGQGKSLQQVQKEIGTTEGTITAKNVFYLLEKYKVKLPICESVYRVLYEQKEPQFLFDTFFSQ
ncbi:glycerol-3-phosphate dehydrogenase [NAD(P)+] [Candidatus Rickettsiella viridis]|uniref:Glycerol-3-phosphate dehydrogenase [NAD(P)+] n=1 Tax=Candidatus Rickettsiella viridis TaxID=676208 RepID=A0A2Z5V2Y8_9COXI|nr:NAD(P)H-dependent glycerol-3-phosphate dehydrogenase [Candidatus Rickettsiella viridis]BBB14842.1 glycerol-3-phosphate dehydrogenase [NAD(P)+] [Candidatus Rickettsiella viridis]